MPDDATLGPPCPHCQTPSGQPGNPYAHWLPESLATAAGRALCTRTGSRVHRGEVYAWACPPGHTCHLTRLPAPDAND